MQNTGFRIQEAEFRITQPVKIKNLIQYQPIKFSVGDCLGFRLQCMMHDAGFRIQDGKRGLRERERYIGDCFGIKPLTMTRSRKYDL
jgi:hypothetical protein